MKGRTPSVPPTVVREGGTAVGGGRKPGVAPSNAGAAQSALKLGQVKAQALLMKSLTATRGWNGSEHAGPVW